MSSWNQGGIEQRHNFPDRRSTPNIIAYLEWPNAVLSFDVGLYCIYIGRVEDLSTFLPCQIGKKPVRTQHVELLL